MGDPTGQEEPRIRPDEWRRLYRGMSARLARAFWRAGVLSLEGAAGLGEEEWLEQKNFGRTTLLELRDLLARHGLKFRDHGRRGEPLGTVWTHDVPTELGALLERLRRCDGKTSDAAVIVWEQCQMLVAEVESLKRDNEALHAMHLSACDRVVQQSELLSRRAEKVEG